MRQAYSIHQACYLLAGWFASAATAQDAYIKEVVTLTHQKDRSVGVELEYGFRR
jgi:hypothetical protein